MKGKIMSSMGTWEVWQGVFCDGKRGPIETNNKERVFKSRDKTNESGMYYIFYRVKIEKVYQKNVNALMVYLFIYFYTQRI
jgi:hypothetical protein